MKILRMRAHRRSTLFIVALAAMASTALAQSKAGKPAKPAKGAKAPVPAKPATPAKADDAGEIEITPDDAKKDAAGSGSGDAAEIEMGDDKPGDLGADLNAADPNAN